MGELDGRVALITGAARGQGAAEARLFAAEGATVVLGDVLDAEGEATAAEVGGEYHHHDVRDEAAWDALVSGTLARHRRLDVLVNNAGIFQGAQLLKTPTELWDRMIAINQTGVFFGMRRGAEAMIEAGHGGSIINVSSVAGLEGIFGATAYGATKWAVTGMTKTAAKELGRHGIRVNSIHPGVIVTDMVTEAIAGAEEKMAARQPIRRLGEPEDIAQMALFLAGDRSSYCSGQAFTVDGGIHG